MLEVIMIYVRDIIEKFGGVLVWGNIDLEIKNISKDTRTIKEGDIYIGIKGESFDGNSFYRDAFEKGAVAVILDNINVQEIDDRYKDRTIVKVEDTLKCIQALAKYKRSLYDIPVIGVTGSVGKTSTKDMIYSVLSTKYKVLKTEGNNNNHIGVPLTILRLQDEDIMIVEMGMNNKGEISFLTDIAKPTIAVITNIGTAHIGNLGSRENIMKAKLEIVEGLSGPLIINNDNDIIHDNLNYIKSLGEVITIGVDNDSDYKADIIEDGKFVLDGVEMVSPINTRAFVYNSMIAYVIGKLCGVNSEDIKRGISSLNLTSGRLEYKEYKDGIILIDDTYNASLDSIKSSLEILKKEKCQRRIAVIGDVLELGDYAEDIHRQIGMELLASNLDYIVTIGNYTKYVDSYLKDNGYGNIRHFDKESDSYDFIEGLLKEGDTVLFKGSHGINLKNIVLHLMNGK